MQRYRFDRKDLMIQAITEMIKHGVPTEDMDIYLSQMGPVDLDLLQECLDEIYVYLGQDSYEEQRAVA